MRRAARHAGGAHRATAAYLRWLAQHRPAQLRVRLQQELKQARAAAQGGCEAPELAFSWWHDCGIEAGANPLICRQPAHTRGDNGNEHERAPPTSQQVVLDLNAELARCGSGYVSLGQQAWQPTRPASAQRVLAYTLDERGDECYQLYVRALSDQGKEGTTCRVQLPPWLPSACGVGTVAWGGLSRAGATAASKDLYFAVRDASCICHWVLKQSVSAEGLLLGEPVLLATEADPSRNLVVSRSKDGAALMLTSATRHNSEVWLLAHADVELPRPQLMVPRQWGASCLVEHVYGKSGAHGSKLVLISDALGSTREQSIGYTTLDLHSLSTSATQQDVAAPLRLPILPSAAVRAAVLPPSSWVRLWPTAEDSTTQLDDVEITASCAIAVSRNRNTGSIAAVRLPWPWLSDRLQQPTAVSLAPDACSIRFGYNLDAHSSTVRLYVDSATRPTVALDLHLANGELRKAPAAGGLSERPVAYAATPPSDLDLVSYRISTPSADGELVPITIVHTRNTNVGADLQQLVQSAAGSICGDANPPAALRLACDAAVARAASAQLQLPAAYTSSRFTDRLKCLQHAFQPRLPTLPCLMTVYGAYGEVLSPAFEAELQPLLKRGAACAWAHVRGGGEKGAAWHAAGSGPRLMHRLEDTVAAARMLIACGLTVPRYLAVRGHSAGALPAAWLANEYPGLLRALLLTSPFLDVLDSMRDPTAPLTAAEYAEWGNPTADTAAAELLQRICPARNAGKHLIAGRNNNSTGTIYPHVFIRTAAEDPRTPPAFAFKYLQQLQAALNAAGSTAQQQQHLALCDVMEHGGHHGSGSYDARLADAATELAFLHDALDLTPRELVS